MIEQGLVERHDDPEDGRAYRLYLSPKGKRLIEQALPAHNQLIAEQFERLTPEQLEQLLELLSELDRASTPVEKAL
jgi:DNA-binding MarR family transcriptional regulator